MDSKSLIYNILQPYGWGAIIVLHGLIAVLRLLYAVKAGVDLGGRRVIKKKKTKLHDWSYYSKPPLIA